MRTTDSGRHWHDVTPPVKVVSSSSFLGQDAGWIEAGALFPRRTEPVYRTLDRGRTWQRLAAVRSDCQLDFVDERHGWCIWIGAAAGSAGVELYRTRDGGSSWTLVSRTGLYAAGSTPGALPYACDKTITFTSPTTGWASSYCIGGTPRLYRSTDAGAHWHPLAQVPLPKGAPTPHGEGLSPPVAAGSEIAVAIEIDGNPGATAIATSGNGGRSWRASLVPGAPKHWNADLIDPRHWRLTDGTRVLATDDAGRHWRTKTPAQKMKDSIGTPLTLNFLSPQLGFALPMANSGPLWWTRDAGDTWQPVRITAAPS